MSGISTAEARSQLSEIINKAAYGKERIVLTRRGKEIVAVVPIEDLRWLEEREDRLDAMGAEAVREEVAREGTIPWEEV